MKVDHFAACNELKVPHEDFHRQFCARCIQPECTRSQHGTSKFEQRVATWEERLFLSVPRMDSRDDRFKDLSSKKFLPIAASEPGRSSEWVDPRDLEKKVTISVPNPVPDPSPPHSEVPNSEAVDPKPLKSEEISKIEPPILRNTPNRPRQMIGAPEQKMVTPVLDPWQPVQPPRPEDVIVKPGARIRLGK